MNNTRTRLLNAAITRYMENPEAKEQISALVDRKLNQPNRLGYRQHRRINPRRQLKKLMLRHKLV
jgi:hypothetical protein